MEYLVELDVCHTNCHRLIFSFKSHSENPSMPHEEKQSLHTQDQEEMSTVEEIKDSRFILFIAFLFMFFTAIKSFLAPFHAAGTA